MARRRYFRKRYYRRAPMTRQYFDAVIANAAAVPVGSVGYAFTTLAENDTNIGQAAPLAQQLTVGGFKVTGSVNNASDVGVPPSLWDGTVYIMFVPENLQVSNTLPADHPEYIMAMKNVGDGEAIGTFSRSYKKLKPGDRVVLLMVIRNIGSVAIPLQAVRSNWAGTFYSKAN